MLGICFTVAASFAPAVPVRASETGEPLRVLIVSGANNHDWEFTTPSLAGMLEESGLFSVEITYEPAVTLANAAALEGLTAFVLDYNGPRWGEPAESNFLAAVEGGVGVTVIHAANNAFPGWTEYESLVGDLWREGTGHGRFHEFDVTVFDREHPITRGLFDLRAHPDELYHDLVRAPGSEHRVLASAWSSKDSGGTGQAEPMILVANYAAGRVFHTPLGHVWRGNEASRASHADRQFRELVVRGTEWAATGDCSGRAAASNLLSKEEHAAGWRLLFNGFQPDGWRGFRKEGFPEAGWKVEDGVLVCGAGGAGGDLITEAQYADFEFEFDWRVTEKANSGVIYRVSEQGNATYGSGPEYQVIDDAYFDEPAPLHEAGALYAIAAADHKRLMPLGQFNRGKVVVRGWTIEHWLNGERLLTCDLAGEDGKARVAASKFASMPLFATFDRGHLALQDHGNEVGYRSLRVRDLSPSGAQSIALFDGGSLAAWAPFLGDGSDPEQVWSVREGVLVCSGTPAGYIRTREDFGNYVLELDWRWNPETKQAGNSGVLLRMIGEDKVWPKSLEAQLQSGNAGDFWVIDGFPAETAADRRDGRRTRSTHSNENPIGEWNHYRITVDRGDVTVEVNGQVLNRATGVLETPGKICLQSEGAEIHFKDVFVRPLD